MDDAALLPAVAAPDVACEIIDGLLVRMSDGEVLGLADRPAFAVDSPEAADWVLEKIAAAEAQGLAVAARRRAVLENLDREARRHAARADWLRRRFGPELEALARRMIAGRRERTARFTWGAVAFRKAPGRHRIVDMARLCAHLVDAGRGDLVRVEASTTVTALKDAGLALDALPFVDATPPGESVQITTGVA